MIYLSDHQTIASQCAIPNAQSNLYLISYISEYPHPRGIRLCVCEPKLHLKHLTNVCFEDIQNVSEAFRWICLFVFVMSSKGKAKSVWQRQLRSAIRVCVTGKRGCLGILPFQWEICYTVIQGLCSQLFSTKKCQSGS